MRLRAAIGALHFDLAAALECGESFDPLDLVLLHQAFDALGVLGHDLVLAVLDQGQVQARVVAVDALFDRILEVIPNVGAVQQRFGWNTADMQTCAAEFRVLLDDRGLETVLAGTHRRRVPARSATDDDEVVCHLIA